jgi:hypothetical protein
MPIDFDGHVNDIVSQKEISGNDVDTLEISLPHPFGHQLVRILGQIPKPFIIINEKSHRLWSQFCH